MEGFQSVAAGQRVSGGLLTLSGIGLSISDSNSRATVSSAWLTQLHSALLSQHQHHHTGRPFNPPTTMSDNVEALYKLGVELVVIAGAEFDPRDFGTPREWKADKTKRVLDLLQNGAVMLRAISGWISAKKNKKNSPS